MDKNSLGQKKHASSWKTEPEFVNKMIKWGSQGRIVPYCESGTNSRSASVFQKISDPVLFDEIQQCYVLLCVLAIQEKILGIFAISLPYQF
jgi:hypothetical protein